MAAIEEHNRTRERIQKFLMQCFPPLVNAYQPLFAIRHYDYVPDVMIFTQQYPVGFPNGRKLTDDVAVLTCDQGDCPLIENSFIDSTQWPRATVNDKPFLQSSLTLLSRGTRHRRRLRPRASASPARWRRCGTSRSSLLA